MVKRGDIVQLLPPLYEGSTALVIRIETSPHAVYQIEAALLGRCFTGLPGLFRTNEVRVIEDDNAAALDRWNTGALDGCRGKLEASNDPDYCAGYREGQRMRKVHPVMPDRPEGYYHQAPDGEDA